MTSNEDGGNGQLSFGRVSKQWQREQAAKDRKAALGDLTTVFAEHERRVKEFLRTAGSQTIAEQKDRQARSLNIQESDDLVFRVVHSIGKKKKNLAQLDGDEE